MLVLTYLLGVAVPAVAPYCPSCHDEHGWGLRVHNLTVRGPYVAEALGHLRFDITLINFSGEVREHDPLGVADRTGDLDLHITGPKGPYHPHMHLCFKHGPRDPFTVQLKVPPGGCSALDFSLRGFGYLGLGEPGEYSLVATLKVGGKTITAPPVLLEVVKGTVLVEHRLPLEGAEAARPAEEQYRPSVQQVRAGDRTYLVYVRRLAELPGQCEMTVEGAYGGWGPLTIAYKTAPGAKPTKLVIHSVSGTPWTEEEERLWQERRKNPKP